MFTSVESLVGTVLVETTSNRGFSPEEIAERATNRIVYVGGQAHPLIREQAEAFRGAVKEVIQFYLREAVNSHNTTIACKLTEAGYPELAALLD